MRFKLHPRRLSRAGGDRQDGGDRGQTGPADGCDHQVVEEIDLPQRHGEHGDF
jgi:hypothetical protein